MGYEKVTGLDQITDGGKYLIAAKAASGAYYVVNPSSAGEKYKHVAKVVEENVPVEEELAVALGTTKDYNDGGEKKISKCLFTFTKQGDDGTFKISAVTDRWKNGLPGTEIIFICAETYGSDRGSDHCCQKRRRFLVRAERGNTGKRIFVFLGKIMSLSFILTETAA